MSKALHPSPSPAVWLRALGRDVALGLLFSLSGVAAGASAQAPAQQPAAAPPSSAPAAAPPASPAPAAGPTDDGEGRPLEFVIDELRRGATPIDSDAAARRAVKTAPSISKAKAAADQARAGASQALIAVYPRVDLLGQYERLSPPPRIAFKVPGPPLAGMDEFEITPPLVDQFLLQARVQYPVSDLFFQVLPRYEAAKQTARAQVLTARAQAFTVALQGREAFYNYARARAALLVGRSAVEQTEAQRKDVEALVRAGTVARVELMRADANLASAHVSVARAEGAVAIARTALRTLLHVGGDEDIALAEDFTQQAQPLGADEGALLQKALENRSELRALKTLAEAYANTAQADDAGKLPKLGVGGTAELGNPNQRAISFERKWTGTWEVMGTLTWSPNDFFGSDARASGSEAQRAQTLADLAALEDAVRTEVSRAYEDHEAARQAMDAAATGIRAAEETYRVRREQFRAGAAVQTDVVIAEGDLNRARLELINAVIDLRIARARLERAIERDPAGTT
jgi:outer membrane protein TolC